MKLTVLVASKKLFITKITSSALFVVRLAKIVIFLAGQKNAIKSPQKTIEVKVLKTKNFLMKISDGSTIADQNLHKVCACISSGFHGKPEDLHREALAILADLLVPMELIWLVCPAC